MEKLKVSSNGKHLTTEQGDPFFYLADTNWTMPQRLKWDDAIYLMQMRKSQGFTATQIVALDPERDDLMRDPSGNQALLSGNLETPNEKYFQYLDALIEAAEKIGLYVLLLPVWGQLVVGENWGGKVFPKVVTEDNSYEFGKWIGKRYAHKKHIIWCLGGDRQPIHKGTDYRNLWRKMAEGLAEGVTGVQVAWNKPSQAWSELLITYHTCYEMETGEYSTMSYWTAEDAWISFIALQSGHGLKTQSFNVVQKEVQREPRKPVIDIEPAYERMPMNWPKFFPLHGDSIVRNRAYWAIFSGAAGHTYGHASVWCSISEKETNEVLVATWFQALSHPGATQIGLARRLAEVFEFPRWIPDQAVVGHSVCQSDCLDTHIQSVRDEKGEFILAYSTTGAEIEVNLASITGSQKTICWFNPRTGSLVSGIETTSNHIGLTTPSEEDWVLIVTSNQSLLGQLEQEIVWSVKPEIEQMSMIWA